MITRKIEIKPTPAELAKVFADWRSDEQALFFSELANCVKKWDNSFCVQAQYISICGKLTTEAKNIMKTIGEYSH